MSARAAGWALPALRTGYPADDALLARRVKAGGGASDSPPGEALIGGVRCLVVDPVGAAAGGTILYLHGGGYRLGSPVAYVDFARRLATASGRRIVLPFYRLAPEFPFPAALHDAAAVYRAMEDRGSVVIAGDSAGGGLTAGLCILAARAGEPPAGAILISPMLDLTAAGESHDRNAARDPLFSRAMVLDAAQLYLQGHDVRDPLVSAIMADPADFPPLLALVGGAEVLLDEALIFTQRLALDDRRVTLHVAAGMGHVWPLMAPDSGAAIEAFKVMGGFAKELVCVSPEASG